MMVEEVNSYQYDKAILEEYPLPIAHEYQQLIDLKDENFWYRCKQLVELLDYSLRYTTLIAINDYYGRFQAHDHTFDEWLAQQLITPEIQDLPYILRRVMKVYNEHRDRLFVPELYDLCFDKKGDSSEAMAEVELAIDRFAVRVKSGEIKIGEVEKLEERYEVNEPRVFNLLEKLEFLREYSLLRFLDKNRNEDEWQVQELMGAELEKESHPWEMGVKPEKKGIALLNKEKNELLPIYPFALFERYKPSGVTLTDLLSGDVSEELFLYKGTETKEVVYTGLKEEKDGITHRISTQDHKTKEDIRILLRVETWPPVQKEPGELREEEEIDWRWLQGLASSQSFHQLRRYEEEKYDQKVYLPRELVDREYREFLKNGKNGFLIVGDSGTGKTNLLCNLVEEAQRVGKDIVLFYNCGEMPGHEELNLGDVIARQIGGYENFDVLLKEIPRIQGKDTGQFLLVLDAINEYQDPAVLLESLWEDVLSKVPLDSRCEWFKLVVSCRSEAWQWMKQHFKGYGHFYESEEGIEVDLTKFSSEELPKVYEMYRVSKKYKLRSEYDDLSESTKLFITDPLMLKLVAESYREEELPVDPKTAVVFGRYYTEKLGDKDDPKIDELEREFISRLEELVWRLVELMYERKNDELDEQELRDDSQIGEWVKAYDDVNSPYFHLLDRGILMRIQVGGTGTATFGPYKPSPPQVKVRFTYDRFFEYLLASYLMPGEIAVEQVRELASEATREHYASLWGALKTRLIAYAELDPEALTTKGALDSLACEEENTAQRGASFLWKGQDSSSLSMRYQVRGLLVDTLASFGTIQPNRTRKFLTQVLLVNDSVPSGLVAIFAAYKLKMPLVFEVAYHNPSSVVKQVAIQHTYYFWSRYRGEGEPFMDQLTIKASDEVKRSLFREAYKKLTGEEFDLSRFPILSAFLGITLLISGHLLTEPEATERFVKNFVDLYNSFGLGKNRFADLVKHWAGEAAIRGWQSGGMINLETLAVFTDRPLNDIRRKEVKRFAPYMGLDLRPIGEISDKLFEWSHIEDGVISLVLVGILVNRSINEPEETLILLQRMFSKGNSMSQYNVVRSMSSTLQRNIDPCPGYPDFFNEAVLEIWTGKEKTVEIKGEEYPIGHLAWPMAYECQKRTQGKLEIVNRMLALSWDGDELSRLFIIISNLGNAINLAYRMSSFRPYPVLETLSQWFHLENLNEEDEIKLQGALGLALARIWRAYPVEVEQFLEAEPELMMAMYETIRRESHGELMNYAGQGSLTSIVFIPAALPDLVRVIENICDKGVDIEETVREIGSFFVDPKTVEKILSNVRTQ